jgi:hypothetical protein
MNPITLLRTTFLLSAALCLPAAVLAQAPVPNGAAPAAGAPAPAAAPAAGQPRPFKDVAKDAKEIPGLFTLWQKDEKVWIEVKPAQFDVPLFFTWNIPRSVGERGLYGAQMGGSRVVVFHKIGNQVQVIARNTEYFARAGTPQERFVAESFSDSLMASAAAASLPHPESKAILVDAGALLFADIPGYLTRLEVAYRQPFALDTRNTSFSRVHNTEWLTGLEVNAHFSVPKIAAPPLAPSAVPLPAPSRVLPDPRSLFVGFYYSFAKLPAVPMAPRVADERIGHFVATRQDYTNDITPRPEVHYVKRWRLEKKDPSAALSEPKEPITYWLDRNIPEKYRETVRSAVLEWNKAFEPIGFRNAIVVKQQAETDDFETLDARHASVRWFTGADVGFNIGPSHMDPRTGEILDADIAISDAFGRGARRVAFFELGKIAATYPAAYHDPLMAGQGYLVCNEAAQSAGELDFALDLLEARGVEMDGPEADAIAKSWIKRTTMHEVGHTLGLRHNFRASTIYTPQQVADREFTRRNGVGGSIMEYFPFNIALKGEEQGEYAMSTIGPYDYWAIEYAYRPLDPANEAAALVAIAERSSEPQLAYGTDEDAGYAQYVGTDPEVNRFDLAGDPLLYYRKRIQLSRELWDRIQSMQLKPGESYERLGRSFRSGFNQVANVAPLAAKYVGGVKVLRDHAGTGRPILQPTPVERQREALQLITDGFLRTDSFRFKPEFVSRIGIDFFDRPNNPDISIADAVLSVQRAILDQLMSDGVAARLLDSQEKVGNPASVLRLPDLYDTLQVAIWSELKGGQDIGLMRRNLQREHVKRITAMLTKGAPATPADARALQRENARALVTQIKAAQGRPGLSKEARAHLAESANTLEEALKAPLQRAGA